MKISMDNQIVRLFSGDADTVLNSLLGADEDSSIGLGWASFLEYLELGQILSQLPTFDKTQDLFIATVSALCEVDNPEDLFYIYDSLFTVMLKQVKSLPEIDPAFLLKKIQDKKNNLSFWELEKVLSPALAAKEKMFKENAPEAMHDLILYLAWDRMCVCMARLFDHPCTDSKYILNLKNLKWCLLESYQHIASQRRTSPSFYRMLEALFYYQMREEHLQDHVEEEWKLLSQSFSVLKDPNELIDVFYIDHAIVMDSEINVGLLCHLTLDPPEVVECRLALARYMIGQIKKETPQWTFTLCPSNIVHLSI